MFRANVLKQLLQFVKVSLIMIIDEFASRAASTLRRHTLSVIECERETSTPVTCINYMYILLLVLILGVTTRYRLLRSIDLITRRFTSYQFSAHYK